MVMRASPAIRLLACMGDIKTEDCLTFEDQPQSMSDLQRSRLAVSLFFFVNGFLHANLVARLPQFQAQLSISDGQLGLLLFCIALGAMLGMPITGGLAARLGSENMARLMAWLFCLIVPLIPMVFNWYAAGFIFLAMGFSMGAMDVCMNGQAVYVERRWGKTIMSSFHAVFSIGMALGAGVGALFSKLEVALTTHIWCMALVSLAIIIWAGRYLIPENQPASDQPSEKAKGFRLPTAAILPLGLIAFCCMTGEGSMADWSAIYMNKVVGKDEAFSAFGFGIYAFGMTLGRLLGDFTTQYFGQKRLLLFDALAATFGLSLALAHVSVPTALIGFFLVGIGVSTVVPIVFSAAGNTPGVHPSVGIAMATSIGYLGFFIGPPAIGYLSDAYGLRTGLTFSLGLFVLMFVLVWRR